MQGNMRDHNVYKQKPKPFYEKRELQSWSYTHENQERWSLVDERKSSGAGAVTFLRQSAALLFSVFH